MIYVLIPTTPDRTEQLDACIAAVKASVCDQPIEIIVEMNQYEGFVKPVLRMLDRVDGICLILGNDARVTPSAIQKLYNAYTKAFPDQDGVCACSDGRDNHGDLICHPFGHSKTLKENIYPKYFHNFVDKDLGQVMWRKGKYIAVPDAVIQHHHYTQKGWNVEKDLTYSIGEETSESDGAIFRERWAIGFGLKPEEVVVDLASRGWAPTK
jgi:hypothetical protein